MMRGKNAAMQDLTAIICIVTTQFLVRGTADRYYSHRYIGRYPHRLFPHRYSAHSLCYRYMRGENENGTGKKGREKS
jgi:hypothetical protein